MDPYKVLGLDSSAADEDIRSAFRRLAKAYHPDLNPTDAAAAEQFRKVSQAYDILGEPARRRQYDMGEIDHNGEPVNPYAFADAWGAAAGGFAGEATGGTRNFNEFFEDIFGQRTAAHGPGGQRAHGGDYGSRHANAHHARRGGDLRYSLEVDFLEAISGTKKRVTLPGGGVLDMNVPPAIAHGQLLRLRGKGAPGANGGPAGDALVEIKVRPHPLFRRVERDIHSEVPISIDEAVLGGRIEVSTISSRVALTLPSGTANGRVFRLRGKGIPAQGGKPAGDHFATVKIVMPDAIDDELRAFFEDWRKANGYDPGER